MEKEKKPNDSEKASMTGEAYEVFNKRVKELLDKYQRGFPEKFELIRRKIEQTKGDWDTSVKAFETYNIDTNELLQLLAFEYCLGATRITQGKISFEEIAERLFTNVGRFRIGNPERGRDDKYLDARGIDSPQGIPVTSTLYKLRHLESKGQFAICYEDSKVKGAAFIFEAETIDKGETDEAGQTIQEKRNALNFNSMNNGLEMLDRLRHLVFHEWTHGMEMEIFGIDSKSIPAIYESPNKRHYLNYRLATECRTYKKGRSLEEPEYILTYKKQKIANRRRDIIREKRMLYSRNKNGQIIPENEIDFDLDRVAIVTPIGISHGLTTEDSKTGRIRNQITEGFTEATARAILRAVDSKALIVKEGYFEQTEMAEEVISARDKAQGEDGDGQTFADFLMRSSVLKRALQKRIVILEDGQRTDGLQFLSEYAEDAKDGLTDKGFFLSEEFKDICKNLGLSDQTIQNIKNMKIHQTRNLSEEQIEQLRELLMCGNNPDKEYVDTQISRLRAIMEEEDRFFCEIPKRLGYTDRTISTEDILRVVKKPHGFD